MVLVPSTLKRVFFTLEYDLKDDSGIEDSAAVWDMIEDQEGNLWMALDGLGLGLVEEGSKRIQWLKADNRKVGAISSNVPRSLFEDINGDIWVSNFSFWY